MVYPFSPYAYVFDGEPFHLGLKQLDLQLGPELQR